MRTPVRRVLALFSALPVVTGALLFGAAPAAQAAPSCSSSVLAFNAIVIGDVRVRVTTTPTETVLCVEAGLNVEAILVVEHALSVTPPNVRTETGAGSCGTTIINVTDPVQQHVNVGWSLSPLGVCIGFGGTWTSVILDGPAVSGTPDADLWVPYGSTLHFLYCTAIGSAGIPCQGGDIQFF